MPELVMGSLSFFLFWDTDDVESWEWDRWTWCLAGAAIMSILCNIIIEDWWGGEIQLTSTSAFLKCRGLSTSPCVMSRGIGNPRDSLSNLLGSRTRGPADIEKLCKHRLVYIKNIALIVPHCSLMLYYIITVIAKFTTGAKCSLEMLKHVDF